MFVCIQIDQTKSFTATFVHLGLFETRTYWAEIEKVDIFATFRTYIEQRYLKTPK